MAAGGRRWGWILLVVAVLVVISRFCGGASDGDGTTTSAAAAAGSTTSTPPSTTTSTTAAVEVHDLVEAAAAGLVALEFRSLGGASGDVVEMEIQRLGDPGRTLKITVPPGLMLHNPAGDQQDLVVAGLEGRLTGPNTYEPASEVWLPDDSVRNYLLEAYCANAHLDNPAAGGALSLGDLAGRDLVAVLGAVDEAGAAGRIVVVRAAVWAITDDVSPADLDAVGCGLDDEELALARAVMEAAGLEPGAYRLFDG